MATTSQDITAKSTHDLWVEARQFTLDIARSTPTTITLTVTYPNDGAIVDGLVMTMQEKSITGNNYPEDGTAYTPSTNYTAPVDRIGGSKGAIVVAFYSKILGNPIPSVYNALTGVNSFSVTITNTDPTVLYYASVHACTNVLQYYPIGIQSYPLEASRVEKDSSSFTGSIPSLPETPTDPSPGMVYHDQGLNIIQYWTGTQWIPSRIDGILTGTTNPGLIGGVYFYSALSQLKVFDGVKWVVGSTANLQFRIPTGWAPLGTVGAGTKLPDTPAVGDFVYNFTTGRPQYWDGISWMYPDKTNTLFNGPPLMPAFVEPLTIESTELLAPYIGQLFYNSSTKLLNVWTGTKWQQANTDQQGTATSDKISIGTDGSYDERIRLIKVLKGQLGWPVQCVELKEEQFNIAIDNALDNYRMWCDGAYRHAWVLYTLIPDQQLYYLNSATDKTDHIVSISKIHRLNILGANSLNWDSNVYFQTFLNQYYSSGYTDILSIHLMHGLSEDFNRIFAGDLMFQWDEPSRELLVTRKISQPEKVIIECLMERTEQELHLDRWCKQFIQNWALAECKMQLGLIRSKYSSGTPGANGAINLNGELLISEARQDQTELKQSVMDLEFGGMIGLGNASFLIG
jgi:hypothetical protein